MTNSPDTMNPAAVASWQPMEELMTSLTRRSVTTGLAAAVAAVPGLAIAGRLRSAEERVAYHTRELEKAMRDLYDTKEVSVLRYEPEEGSNPLIMICPQMPD